ncbi:NO-binding membrane sensor protein with MHYT domain [Nocardia tenerifensis]|uniref:NO-binding membrane sensor protein with MHYT domain n=1 Tax=Nocardia tenerifensis TaxID=228006 RepID=A0A318KBU3_9NOCA|nr:MHYT domain-containing protein [Nocardia tenerifensis]PXX68499.1 NO-binding membrane sensor protein with MHYT domain [Nocardia tenerifensis]
MTYFSMGYWIIGLSLAVSITGALVGFSCIRQSTKSVTPRFRLVWQASAAISIGGIGVWLSVFVSMLGVTVPGSLVRYDVWSVALAAVVSVLGVWAALVIQGRTLNIPRLIGAGVVMGAGFGLMHYLALGAMHIQGSISLKPLLFCGAVAIAIVISLGTLWFTQPRRPLAMLAGAAVVFAAGIAGMHYTDLVGVEIDLATANSTPPGEDLFGFFVPAFALGMLSLAIPISAILIAPDRRTAIPTRAPVSHSAY